VIVGNSSTYNYEGMMINPRGYRSKYELVPTASSQSSPNNDSDAIPLERNR
jgi:hypothetical protein